MKKQITRILSVLMTLTMLVGLTACDKKVTLKNQKINDVTFDVPSDFGKFEKNGQISMAKNEDSTAAIVVSERLDAGGASAADYDEDTYQQSQLSTYTDVTFEEFDTDATFSGQSALFALVKGTSEKGVKMTLHNYIVFFEDGTYQNILFSYANDGDTSLHSNIDKVIKSVKFL